MTTQLLIAKTQQSECYLLPEMVNRHGLITGTTGTGKTVTLQKLAESLSSIGIPIFMADVKGDLTGIAQPGNDTPKLQARLADIGVSDWSPQGNPVVLWDLFGEKGHRVRATIRALGPLLFARLLMLNEVQSGVLQIIFRIADDQNLPLLDFKDLQTLTQHVGNHARSLQTQYGNINSASIGAIQRGLLSLEQQGANHFFSEPMLDIHDWLKTDSDGRGFINILSAEKLYKTPKLYATSLLWMLTELYEQLSETGDTDKPRLVFFFDEAHLLFNDAPKVLLDNIERVVRLVRSKGVGIWFVSQSPADIPETVLGQLGNRVQHALRAFTPKDQKAVKSAAQSMRANPAFDTTTAIQQLSTGEALISFLDQRGSPTVVQREMVIAPTSRMGPIDESERQQLIMHSPFVGKYDEDCHRESAFERLQTINHSIDEDVMSSEKQQNHQANFGLMDIVKGFLFGRTGPRGGKYDGFVQQTTKRVTRQIINQVIHNILASITGKRRR